MSSKGEKHWLELNWYADDSPVAGPFREGEELDHLGFEVGDFERLLKKLNAAGYPTRIGPVRWSLGSSVCARLRKHLAGHLQDSQEGEETPKVGPC